MPICRTNIDTKYKVTAPYGNITVQGLYINHILAKQFLIAYTHSGIGYTNTIESSKALVGKETAHTCIENTI